ncbi:hypothetical protein IWX49DRAFT_229816 [Phyllosticta citricarpa]
MTLKPGADFAALVVSAEPRICSPSTHCAPTAPTSRKRIGSLSCYFFELRETRRTAKTRCQRQEARCIRANSCFGSLHTPHRSFFGQTDPQKQNRKTYNSRDSLLVTHATTNRPQGSLSMEERTGFRVFYLLWSYVEDCFGKMNYVCVCDKKDKGGNETSTTMAKGDDQI